MIATVFAAVFFAGFPPAFGSFFAESFFAASSPSGLPVAGGGASAVGAESVGAVASGTGASGACVSPPEPPPSLSLRGGAGSGATGFLASGKGAPIGLDALTQAARHTAWPVFALGGVGVDQVSELVRAGAAGVAAISEVFYAAQPERAILALLRALTAARSS